MGALVSHLYGSRAMLVLRDDEGEYEVANALRFTDNALDSTVVVDTARVLDALDKRVQGITNPSRPIL
jgi:hypothetical protein